MPIIQRGDITEAGLVLLTVSCDGHMGAGVNLRMRERYPRWFETYRADCAAGRVVLGVPMLYHVGINRWIVAIPVKRGAHEPANEPALRSALDRMAALVAETNQGTLAVDIAGMGIAQIGADALSADLTVRVPELRMIVWYAEPVRVLCQPSDGQNKHIALRTKPRRDRRNKLRRSA